MIEKELTIKNKLGIHLRPAAQISQLVNKFKSSVKISNEQGTAEGRSIMSVMMLTAIVNSKIKIRVEGIDENEVFNELQQLVEVKKFDEE